MHPISHDHPVDRSPMESHEMRDRLSALPDHLLLSVLDRDYGGVKFAVRTGVLSKRWKRLPWLVSELVIKTSYFDPGGLTGTKSSRDLQRAMAAFAEATKRFLAVPASERTIKSLSLQFYFLEFGSSSMSDIATSLREAIAGGKIAGDGYLDLLIAASSSSNPSLSGHCLMEAPIRYPDVFGRLNLLSISHATFKRSDDIARILRTCTHLETLGLDRCVCKGGAAVVEINAPAESRLKVLYFFECRFRRIELRQAPKLEELCIDHCLFPTSEQPPHAPLLLPNNCVVPCLKELEIATQIHGASPLNFELSEMLGRNATAHLEHLHLRFGGCKMWVKPEDPKQLFSAFGKLRSLTLEGIEYEYDLSWTLLLLRAAPALEKLELIIHFKHPDQPEEIEWRYELLTLSAELLQKTPDFKHCSLKKFEFNGFTAEIKQIQYVRLVLEQAVSLKQVLLRRNCWQPIGSFEELLLQQDCSEIKSTFAEDERDLIVKQLKEGISSTVQIAIY